MNFELPHRHAHGALRITSLLSSIVELMDSSYTWVCCLSYLSQIHHLYIMEYNNNNYILNIVHLLTLHIRDYWSIMYLQLTSYVYQHCALIYTTISNHSLRHISLSGIYIIFLLQIRGKGRGQRMEDREERRRRNRSARGVTWSESI